MAAAPAPAAAAAAASSASTSEWRQAAWKFEGQDSSELSFDPGMIIRVDGKVHEEWWKGTTAEGEVGLFPANHSTPVRTAKEGELVLVLYDFMGKRDTDLGSLSKGETISVLVEQEMLQAHNEADLRLYDVAKMVFAQDLFFHAYVAGKAVTVPRWKASAYSPPV